MVSQKIMSSAGGGHVGARRCSVSQTRARPPSSAVVQDLAQRGLGLAPTRDRACWQHQPARRARRASSPRAAASSSRAASSGLRRASHCSASARAALVGVAGAAPSSSAAAASPPGRRRPGRATPGVQQPVAQAVHAERGEPHHAVAGDLLGSDRLLGELPRLPRAGVLARPPRSAPRRPAGTPAAPIGSSSRKWSSSRIIASETSSSTASVGSSMSLGHDMEAASTGSGTASPGVAAGRPPWR